MPELETGTVRNAMDVRQFAKIRTTCGLCGSSELRTTIPLRALPVASPNVGDRAAVTELASADLNQCNSCGHIQLAAVVDPEFQYRNFRYFTGISLGLRQHFERLVTGLSAEGQIAPGKLVVDIGSNDGSLLKCAQRYTDRVLGVDPASEIAKLATENGIPTLAEFFDAELANKIVEQTSRADVIISNNTVANIDDLDSFFVGIDRLLADDGIVIIETQYGMDVLTRTLLDVIYHEHISYFVVRPFRDFLQKRGFSLVGAERIAPKGGSIRFKIQRAGGSRTIDPLVDELVRDEIAHGLYDGRLFCEFHRRVSELGERIRTHLQNTRRTSGKCFAYGSSVGCAALIHYFDLCDMIDAIFDDQPLVSAMHTAKGNIPIKSGHLLSEEGPTDVLVLAWRYANVIARGQARFRERGGRFFVGLPDLTFVDGSDLTAPAA